MRNLVIQLFTILTRRSGRVQNADTTDHHFQLLEEGIELPSSTMDAKSSVPAGHVELASATRTQVPFKRIIFEHKDSRRLRAAGFDPVETPPWALYACLTVVGLTFLTSVGLLIWSYIEIGCIDDDMHQPQPILGNATCYDDHPNFCNYNHSVYSPEFVETCGPSYKDRCHFQEVRIGMYCLSIGSLVFFFALYCKTGPDYILPLRDLIRLRRLNILQESGDANAERIVAAIQEPSFAKLRVTEVEKDRRRTFLQMFTPARDAKESQRTETRPRNHVQGLIKSSLFEPNIARLIFRLSASGNVQEAKPQETTPTG